MRSKTGRLLVVIGLPGSGKSRLIDDTLRHKVTGLCVHDYHANAINHSPEAEMSRHFIALREALLAGHDCVIADIEFCRSERREPVVNIFTRAIPALEVEFHCMKNQLERCKKNIERRARKGANEEKQKAENLSVSYEIPIGAIEYDVWDAN